MGTCLHGNLQFPGKSKTAGCGFAQPAVLIVFLKNFKIRFQDLLAEKLSLDDLSGFGSLLVHLLRESEVGYACDVVAAHLGSVGLKLPVCENIYVECCFYMCLQCFGSICS